MPYGRSGSSQDSGRHGGTRDCVEGGYGAVAETIAAIQCDEHSKLRCDEERGDPDTAARARRPSANDRLADESRSLERAPM